METRIDFDSRNVLKLYLRAETTKENVELLNLVKRLKAPIQSFGRFDDNGFLWIWINMPANKKVDKYDALAVSNGAPFLE
jgi:hypothetical protein